MAPVTFPTYLTLTRLIVAPLTLPVLLVYLLPFNSIVINSVLAFLFILFSLTDFFDGYLARKFALESVLGKLLDPIADKFLVYSTLVALLAVGKIYFLWVIILIGREFFVMGLRTIALQYNFSVAVSDLGKLKTVFQVLVLTLLIFNPYQAMKADALIINGLEMALIIVTVILSVVSAQHYFSCFMGPFDLALRAEEST